MCAPKRLTEAAEIIRRLFYVIIAIELRIERAAFLFGEIIMATRKMMRRNRRSSKQSSRKSPKQQLHGIVKDKPKKPPVKPSKQPEQPEPGQPTKYKPEYCQQLIDYFSIEPLKIVAEQKIIGTEGGKYVSRRLPQRFPWFEGFARKIGVHRNTLKNWCAEYPEFAEAYDTAKDLQREFIVDVALSGAAPPSFAIFTMKNVCGWRDERDLKLKKAKEEGDIDDDELKTAIFE